MSVPTKVTNLQNNAVSLEEEEEEYHGYKTVGEEDLKALQSQQLYRGQGTLSTWQKPKSLKLKVMAFVLFISFILIFVWQILVGTCNITRFCKLIDVSSQQDSPYSFKTLRFYIPSSLIWTNLTVGSFMLFTSCLLTNHLFKQRIFPKSLEFIGYFIRQASNIILLTQYLIIILPSFVLFISIGLTINWSTAVSFSLGAMTCTMTAYIATSICTKANIRSSKNSKTEEFSHSLNIASVAAIIIYSSTLGCASLAVAAAYLLYSDVHALTGFIAGSSLASFFLRTSSTLSFDSMVTAFKFQPPFRQVIPPNAVAVVSSGVSIVTGLTSDIYGSFSLCIIATAFLGSGLPFFGNNPFSLCVFNHLVIDKVCGPFGYPENVSFASVICRSDNLYMSYPSLNPENSVSIFVSVPFLLFSSTLGVYFLSAIAIQIYEKQNKQETSSTDASQIFLSLKKKSFISIIICAILLIISSSAIFFGLFGSSTNFQKSKLHGFGKKVSTIVLDGSDTQCTLGFSTIPRSTELKEESYHPIFPSGSSYGSVEGIPFRLFSCNFIGIVAGVLVALVSYSSYFSDPPDNSDLGTLSVVFRRFSTSLLLQIPITAIILATILFPFKLYGSFGVGIATIGFLSSTGVNVIMKLIGILLTNAQSTEVSNEKHYHHPNQSRQFIHEFNRFTTMNSQIISNGSTILSAVTGLFALVQKSGLWLSPRSLAGSVNVPPTNLIFFYQGLFLPNIFVIVSMLLGALLPFIIGALFVTASFRTGLAIYVGRRSRQQLTVSMSPSFVGEITKLSFKEGSFIYILSIMLPLCIGTGFGQRPLVSYLVGVSGISFVIGTAFCGAPIKQISRGKHSRSRSEFTTATKQNISPCLQSTVKCSVSMGMLVCALIQTNESKGWIGGILLCVTIMVLIGFGFWTRRRFIEIVYKSGLRDESNKWQAPERTVSPFYEDDSAIDPRNVNPSSLMADVMRFFGVQNDRPVSTARVNITNGIICTVDSPDEPDVMIIPRPRARVERGVVHDDARKLHV